MNSLIYLIVTLLIWVLIIAIGFIIFCYLFKWGESIGMFLSKKIGYFIEWFIGTNHKAKKH